jgi:division protein CdvB (Snf7/Vps24/ESCRT-III family)
LKIENKIVSYLVKYGNTRQSDVISFCVKKFNLSPKDAKKVVDRMVVKNKIYRIVHDKLEPPEVYLTLKESVHPDVLRALIEVDTSEIVGKDARKILEEAAAVAEKRIREMESEKS